MVGDHVAFDPVGAAVDGVVAEAAVEDVVAAAAAQEVDTVVAEQEIVADAAEDAVVIGGAGDHGVRRRPGAVEVGRHVEGFEDAVAIGIEAQLAQ